MAINPTLPGRLSCQGCSLVVPLTQPGAVQQALDHAQESGHRLQVLGSTPLPPGTITVEDAGPLIDEVLRAISSEPVGGALLTEAPAGPTLAEQLTTVDAVLQVAVDEARSAMMIGQGNAGPLGLEAQLQQLVDVMHDERRRVARLLASISAGVSRG